MAAAAPPPAARPARRGSSPSSPSPPPPRPAAAPRTTAVSQSSEVSGIEIIQILWILFWIDPYFIVFIFLTFLMGSSLTEIFDMGTPLVMVEIWILSWEIRSRSAATSRFMFSRR